jgi:hypothetical protein
MEEKKRNDDEIEGEKSKITDLTSAKKRRENLYFLNIFSGFIQTVKDLFEIDWKNFHKNKDSLGNDYNRSFVLDWILW